MSLESERTNREKNVLIGSARPAQARKQPPFGFWRVLWVFLLSSFYAATALSQGATVVGRVIDPSEGILAKVEITASLVGDSDTVVNDARRTGFGAPSATQLPASRTPAGDDARTGIFKTPELPNV